MIRNILQQYRDESAFNRDLGDRFERLMRAYLKLDPQYVALFSDVWLWKDWPEREAMGYKAPDTGIDLVAKLREEEGYCAIQCKFYDTPIPLGDLGNFFTLSGKGGFTQRLIVATANLSKHAADALAAVDHVKSFYALTLTNPIKPFHDQDGFWNVLQPNGCHRQLDGGCKTHAEKLVAREASKARGHWIRLQDVGRCSFGAIHQSPCAV